MISLREALPRERTCFFVVSFCRICAFITFGDRARLETYKLMASLSVIPDKFSSGDFVSWLRSFECCATANEWEDDDKLKKLPAFLRGPSAAYFHGLPDGQKDTYAHLTAALKTALCPTVNREQFYADFECRLLRPDEDPSLFQWDLEDLLSKADPTLSNDARNALLTRQFMKGLPSDLRIRLLEFNPMPSLNDMREFVQRHHAVHRPVPAAVFASGQGDKSVSTDNSIPNSQSSPADVTLRESIQNLTAAVAALTVNQQKLQSTLDSKQMPTQFPTNRWRWRERGGVTQRRCFTCNEIGHLARFCPLDIQWCSICHEWGHPSAICDAARQRRPAMEDVAIGNQRHLVSKEGNDFPIGNGHFHSSHVSSKSLNLKGVPH